MVAGDNPDVSRMINGLIDALNALSADTQGYRALQPESSHKLTESLLDANTLFSELIHAAQPQNVKVHTTHMGIPTYFMPLRGFIII